MDFILLSPTSLIAIGLILSGIGQIKLEKRVKKLEAKLASIEQEKKAEEK